MTLEVVHTMHSIRIFTDSTADLTPELLAANHVTVVPLVVQFGQESYRDGVEIDTRQLFAKVAETGQLPKTGSPSPAAFQEAFTRATAAGSQALFIGISTRFSSTVQNAQIAASLFPEGQVRVFDSANLCNGIGLLVLLACDLVRAGHSLDQVVAELERARPLVRSAFRIDTLDYLYKGGRCSGVTALVGGLLSIKPVIAVEDGGMVVATKLRGHRQKGLDWMLERFAADAAAGRVQTDRVFVAYTDVPEDAHYMADAIQRILPGVQILEATAGSVISSHCGPGTSGLFYLNKA